LTKNNEKTIENTLKSIQDLKCPILVADVGSEDSTISLCKSFDTKIFKLPQLTRENARNHLLNLSKTKNQMYLEPWETLVSGHGELRKSGNYNFNIINGGILTYEVRLWSTKANFKNPVCEFLDLESNIGLDVNIYSSGNPNTQDLLNEINSWKNSEPFSPIPYYYQANILLSQKRYEEFLKTAEHFMFLKQSQNKSLTLIRYYYAYVQLWIKKNAKPAIQNLLMCLSENPLMAEFWCLLGDVHYHLLEDYEKAREFYHNGLILGQHRIKYDGWPIDISKYKSHPNRMIDSCNKIIAKQVYVR
jgi:tetratricopeptide (TPR) repeat protein